MHILLHSDSNTDGSHLMADHLQNVVQDAMARFAERVTRVEAHLSDVTSLASNVQWMSSSLDFAWLLTSDIYASTRVTRSAKRAMASCTTFCRWAVVRWPLSVFGSE